MMKRNAKNFNDSMEQEKKAKDRSKNTENSPGFGDKKLEGPNRPST